MHNCTQEELGFVEGKEDEAKFYKIHKTFERDAKFYSPKLQCLDDKIELQGNFNTDKARVLKVVFDKCDNSTIVPKNTCHSDEEIYKWLKAKYIFIVYNQMRFQTKHFDQ